MVAIAFYLGAVALFTIGWFLLKGTSALGRLGGRQYEKRKRRRIIAQTLMAVALIPLVLGILQQVFSGSTPLDIPVANTLPIAGSFGLPTTNAAASASQNTHSAPTETNPGTTDLAASGISLTAHSADLVSGDAGEMSPSSIASPTDGTNSTAAASPSAQADSAKLFQQALQLFGQKQIQAAMSKVNAAIQADPKNENAYSLRGSIYAQDKFWSEAVKDYQSSLELDPTNTRLKMNIADIQYLQKKYDAARVGFVQLQADKDSGDYAGYMVFLCDLLGGHADAAAKELDAFNQAGENASYYFSNAAWLLHNKKTDEANDWLNSAFRIYPPAKFGLYSQGLKVLITPGMVPPASVAPTSAIAVPH